MNAIKEFATSFSSLTLHAVNLLPLNLFKIITVTRPSTLQNFPYGEIRMSKQGRELGGASPWWLKIWTFLFCWVSPPVALPSPNQSPHTGKKISLIAFRQILPNILSAVYIFSSTIMATLKNLSWNKSLNTKQCPTGLSSKIIPLNPYGKPWRWGRIPANSQKFTNFPHQKNPP